MSSSVPHVTGSHGIYWTTYKNPPLIGADIDITKWIEVEHVKKSSPQPNWIEGEYMKKSMDKNPPKENPNYMIQIIYDQITETHDGYCSDESSNITKDSKIKTKTYPLYESITLDLFDKDNEIINPKLLEPLYGLYFLRCVDGGFCGLGTTYTITSAFLIKI